MISMELPFLVRETFLELEFMEGLLALLMMHKMQLQQQMIF